MKTLLFTTGLIAGMTIALGLDYFRLAECRAISKDNFRNFIKQRDSTRQLQADLDSCNAHLYRLDEMKSEIKKTGNIQSRHNQGSVKIVLN